MWRLFQIHLTNGQQATIVGAWKSRFDPVGRGAHGHQSLIQKSFVLFKDGMVKGFEFASKSLLYLSGEM
jgi:hypothetical protein